MLALRGPQYVMATELDEIKSILASDVDEDEEADLSALDKIKTKAKEMSSRTVLLPILIMMLMLTLQVSHFFTSYLTIYFFKRNHVCPNVCPRKKARMLELCSL